MFILFSFYYYYFSFAFSSTIYNFTFYLIGPCNCTHKNGLLYVIWLKPKTKRIEHFHIPTQQLHIIDCHTEKERNRKRMIENKNIKHHFVVCGFCFFMVFFLLSLSLFLFFFSLENMLRFCVHVFHRKYTCTAGKWIEHEINNMWTDVNATLFIFIEPRLLNGLK